VIKIGSGEEKEVCGCGCQRCREEIDWLRSREAELLAETRVLRACLAHGQRHQSERQGRCEQGLEGPARKQEVGRGQRSGQGGHGRRRYEHLPRQEEIVEPRPEELICGKCGAAYERLGEDSSYQIDWLVKLMLKVWRRPRWRRSCKCRESKGIVQAPPPAKVIPKGLYTAGFIVRLLILKYALGMPCGRIIALLEMEGLPDVSAGSLSGMMRAAGKLLEPLAEAIREHNGQSVCLHVDETSWRVMVMVEGKTNHYWWLWVFLGPDSVSYVIRPTREAKVVAEHLGIELGNARPELGQGSLVLSSDRYSVYDSLGQKMPEQVVNAWCWAHVRRDFLGLKSSDGEFAEQWLERIRRLYRAHWRERAALSEAEPSPPASEGEPNETIREVLGEMEREIKVGQSDPKLGPAAQKVLNSLEYYWEGLSLPYLLNPYLDLDNNAAERSLRGQVVGRKNFYGSGSQWSANLAADCWTILATCEMAGWDRQRYLLDYLEACSQAGGTAPPDLDRFLPWQASQQDRDRWASRPCALNSS